MYFSCLDLIWEGESDTGEEITKILIYIQAVNLSFNILLFADGGCQDLLIKLV